jgi:hypothetical protein
MYSQGAVVPCLRQGQGGRRKRKTGLTDAVVSNPRFAATELLQPAQVRLALTHAELRQHGKCELAMRSLAWQLYLN